MIMESKTKTSKLTKNSSGNHSNRFLKCFRKPEMDMDGTHHDQQQVFTYLNVGDKQGILFPGILSEDDVDVDVRKNKKKKKTVSGRKLLLMMRAVMFETSLAKKIKKKKQKKSEKSGNHQESSEDENGRGISTGSSSTNTSSSACSSSLSSSARHDQSDRTNSFSFRSNTTFEGIKQSQDSLRERGKGCHGHTIGCCFLLISLFVLVFWGKICAIICTSTWLFLVPRRWSSGNVSSLKNVDDYAKFGSEKYKKKIIMEGLLERNHSRGL